MILSISKGGKKETYLPNASVSVNTLVFLLHPLVWPTSLKRTKLSFLFFQEKNVKFAWGCGGAVVAGRSSDVTESGSNP